MSQTLLELKVADGLKNDDNSYFQTVYGEPLLLQKGSTIDFVTGFIDLGAQSQNIIEIPTNLKLGIDFYRYDYDIAKVPTVIGQDGDIYQKRVIYYGAPFPVVALDANGNAILPLPETYGYRRAAYEATNLASFLLTRTGSLDDNITHTRTDTFVAQVETATINIPKGTYTKLKITQIINDQFNLIQGSLTNADKPLEYIAPTSPVDYAIAPNNNSIILKAFEYDYTTADVLGPDPVLNTTNTSSIPQYYSNDKNWNYWFFPVFTEPPFPQYFINYDFLPYVWMNQNQSGFLAGTSKFNLEYDPDNDLFFIDYTHSPIIDQNQKEVVVFSKSKQIYSANAGSADAPQIIGYKANGAAGGIMIARLFSYELDDNFNAINNTNTGFWQDVLGFGFDDASFQNIQDNMITKNLNFYVNWDAKSGIGGVSGLVTVGQYNFNITYPDPNLLVTNSTAALIPIQWLAQSNYTTAANDKGFSIYSNDIPKVFESIGNRPIYGDRKAFNLPLSHYLVELNISHVKNDNYRDKDSYYQIMSVAGKTYNSGSNYIQTFDDGSVQTLNIEEDVYIDKIEVRILNPDKSSASGLGSNSTVFLKLTQPVTLG